MISFIVPVYNAEPYLKACVESLLNQTESDIQVILVDDGSTDGSLALARQLAAQDPRVLVIVQRHSGQSAARNNGLLQAQGKYIAFVDADDYLALDWCEQHLRAIDGVDYVQSGYNDNRLPRNRYQFTSPCMRLYRKRAIEGLHFVPGIIYEDVLWSVDLWQRRLHCAMIPYAGYHYTANPNSTTSRKRPEAERRIFQALRERRKGASLRGRWLILYTTIRLKLHFLKS